MVVAALARPPEGEHQEVPTSAQLDLEVATIFCPQEALDDVVLEQVRNPRARRRRRNARHALVGKRGAEQQARGLGGEGDGRARTGVVAGATVPLAIDGQLQPRRCTRYHQDFSRHAAHSRRPRAAGTPRAEEAEQPARNRCPAQWHRDTAAALQAVDCAVKEDPCT